MWTDAALSITGLLSFGAGFILCGVIFSRGCDGDDEKTEKRGVWIIKDRAYRLTSIPKELKDPR